MVSRAGSKSCALASNATGSATSTVSVPFFADERSSRRDPACRICRPMTRKRWDACCCRWLASLTVPETARDAMSAPRATAMINSPGEGPPAVRPDSGRVDQAAPGLRRRCGCASWACAEELDCVVGKIRRATSAERYVLKVAGSAGGAGHGFVAVCAIAMESEGFFVAGFAGFLVFTPADHDAQVASVAGVVCCREDLGGSAWQQLMNGSLPQREVVAGQRFRVAWCGAAVGGGFR